MQILTRTINIATCIAQVRLELVHFSLLFNQLWFGLTFLEVLANYPNDRYELGCDLKLDLKGMTIWITSFPAISADASSFLGGARCERLKSLFSHFLYPQHLINTFVNSSCRS